MKLVRIEELTLSNFSGWKSDYFKNFYNKWLYNQNEIKFKAKQQFSQKNSIKVSFEAYFNLFDFYIFLITNFYRPKICDSIIYLFSDMTYVLANKLKSLHIIFTDDTPSLYSVWKKFQFSIKDDQPKIENFTFGAP